MGETIKKNHWIQSKVDNATKRINQEIYERNRQAPINIKLDDMAIYINDKITRRGIAKGLVNIQEDFNKSILEVEKQTIKALISQDKVKQYEYLTKAKFIIKVDMWTDIRFLMVNKAITPGNHSTPSISSVKGKADTTCPSSTPTTYCLR